MAEHSRRRCEFIDQQLIGRSTPDMQECNKTKPFPRAPKTTPINAHLQGYLQPWTNPLPDSTGSLPTAPPTCSIIHNQAPTNTQLLYTPHKCRPLFHQLSNPAIHQPLLRRLPPTLYRLYRHTLPLGNCLQRHILQHAILHPRSLFAHQHGAYLLPKHIILHPNPIYIRNRQDLSCSRDCRYRDFALHVG